MSFKSGLFQVQTWMLLCSVTFNFNAETLSGVEVFCKCMGLVYLYFSSLKLYEYMQHCIADIMYMYS